METALPKLGTITGEPLQTLKDQTYDFQDPSIKLVSFFYTNCPNVCPMTFSDLSILKEELKQKGWYGNKVKFVSITLDPEYDTKERLTFYAESFNVDHEGWIILRGSNEETKSITDQFRMTYKKDDSGFITHRTNMYLVDSQNVIRAYHDMTIGDKRVNTKKIVEDIAYLLSEN
jgi:protein SCO1